MKLPQALIDKFLAGLSVRSENECWPFAGGSHNKPGWHRLIAHAVDGKKQNHPAHRVAYEYFKGDIGVLFVLHKCDNPVCCNPDHLFLGTQADNCKDMWAKGRAKADGGGNIGTKRGPHPKRKVDVEKAVSMYLAGDTQKQIAAACACSDVAVGNFLRNDARTKHLVGRTSVAAAERRKLRA